MSGGLGHGKLWRHSSSCFAYSASAGKISARMNSSRRERSRCTLSEYSNIQEPLVNSAGLRPAEIRDGTGETAGLGGVLARRIAEPRARRHALEDRGEPE